MSTIHRVKQGECLGSLAAKHGLAPETIWDDPANAELRRERDDGQCLAAGDELVIPESVPKEVAKPTGSKHKFVLHRAKFRLRLKLARAGEAMANQPYILTVDGHAVSGATNGEGMLDEPIAANAKQATLRWADGEELHLDLGHLDPFDTVRGVQQRLINLGYFTDAADAQISQSFGHAVKRFQAANNLPETGDLDTATCEKLKTVHGN